MSAGNYSTESSSSLLNHLAASASFKTSLPLFISAQKQFIDRWIKVRVVILYGTNQLAHLNLGFQLFLDFSHKCFLRCFTLFDLSSWKLPATFKFTIASSVANILSLSRITATTTRIVFINSVLQFFYSYSFKNSCNLVLAFRNIYNESFTSSCK